GSAAGGGGSSMGGSSPKTMHQRSHSASNSNWLSGCPFSLVPVSNMRSTSAGPASLNRATRAKLCLYSAYWCLRASSSAAIARALAHLPSSSLAMAVSPLGCAHGHRLLSPRRRSEPLSDLQAHGDGFRLGKTYLIVI